MQTPPFNDYLGTELTRESGGEAEAILELRSHHLNVRGVAHGGVITGLLDSVLGAAVISAIPDDWWCATTSIATQFVDGAGERTVGRLGPRDPFRKVTWRLPPARCAIPTGRIIATAQRHLAPLAAATRQATHGKEAVPYVCAAAHRTIRVGKILAVGRNYAAHKKRDGNGPGGTAGRVPQALHRSRAGWRIAAHPHDRGCRTPRGRACGGHRQGREGDSRESARWSTFLATP